MVLRRTKESTGYRRLSPARMLAMLATLAFVYSILVYVIPTLSGQEVIGSYDAYTYAANLSQDAAAARELQPFLAAYPAFLSRASLPLYALALHWLLMAIPLMAIRKSLGAQGLVATIAALSIPESAMFLGSVSKEGLGIVAVVAAIAGLSLYLNDRKKHGALMCAYAVGIAEFSRPFYGIPFGAALLVGFLPSFSIRARHITYLTLAVGLVLGIWAVLSGPFSSEFKEQYQNAKQFLDWFEEEMGSDSPVKSAARGFFALAFSGEEPSLSLLILIALAAIGKALVYVIAIPLVAPATFTDMPAQTWALTWQVATSASSIVMMIAIFKLRSKQLSVGDRCRLCFGATLMFMISVSTAIFHVRYRAPAVVVILMAAWVAMPWWRKALPWMNLPALLAACVAIASTI